MTDDEDLIVSFCLGLNIITHLLSPLFWGILTANEITATYTHVYILLRNTCDEHFGT